MESPDATAVLPDSKTTGLRTERRQAKTRGTVDPAQVAGQAPSWPTAAAAPGQGMPARRKTSTSGWDAVSVNTMDGRRRQARCGLHRLWGGASPRKKNYQVFFNTCSWRWTRALELLQDDGSSSCLGEVPMTMWETKMNTRTRLKDRKRARPAEHGGRRTLCAPAADAGALLTLPFFIKPLTNRLCSEDLQLWALYCPKGFMLWFYLEERARQTMAVL